MFFMTDCMYCQQEAALKQMALICELPYSTVYLPKNQNFPGRCVVALKAHKTELFQLTKAEQAGFMQDLSRVSAAIQTLFSPDKINYAVYGDMVPHLHFHLVPKHKDGFCWGAAFAMSGNNNILSDDDARILAQRFCNTLTTDYGSEKEVCI